MDHRVTPAFRNNPNNYCTWHKCLVCRQQEVPPFEISAYMQNHNPRAVINFNPGNQICRDCNTLEHKANWVWDTHVELN